MKYKVGDTIYMMNGEKCTVIFMRNQLFDFRYYLINDKNGDKFLFEMSELESISYSEKEWQQKQQRESFKFKVGDKILLPNLYPSSAIYHVDEIECDYYILSVKFKINSVTTGQDIAKYRKGTVENYGKLYVENKQFIPSKNEQYFFVDLADENLFGVATFLNDATDAHMLKLGLIKETPQECVKSAKQMLKKLDLEV